MASKTIDHMDFYVAITPYKTDENSDQTFDSLRVSVGYRKGRCFYVGYHPGWGDERIWGCLFDFTNNPLTAGASIDVEPATKNSAKRIAEMTESLKMAKDIIAALFDDREWEKLKVVLQNVARFGYTEKFKEQGEAYLAARVSKRYEKVVKPTEPVVKQVDVMGLMGALQTKGKAKLSDFATPIESDNKAAIKREESDACIDSTEREQAQTKFNSSTNNSNSTTMEKNVKAADLIGKTIVVGDNQATIVIKSVDGEKLSGEFTKDGKTTPMSFPVSQLQGMTEKGLWKISDANEPSAVSPKTPDIKTEADVAEVQDIVPVVTPKEKTHPQPLPVKGGESEKPKPKAEPKPKAKAKPIPADAPTRSLSAIKHQPSKGKYVYSTYQTSKGKTGAKITGFNEDDAAYANASELHGSGSYETKKDKKTFYVVFGPRYAAAAKAVCDALNAGKGFEDCKAIIDKATDDRAQKREEWKQKRAERAANAAEPKDANEQAMFELFKKFMAGDKDAMAEVGAMIKKAA